MMVDQARKKEKQGRQQRETDNISDQNNTPPDYFYRDNPG